MVQMFSVLDSAVPETSPLAGRPPNREANAADFGGQIGQALQGFGATVGKIAEVYNADMKQRQQFEQNSTFIDWQSARQQDFLKSSNDIAGTSAVGFTENTVKNLDAQWAEYSKNIPEAMRPQMQMKFAEYRKAMVGQALAYELKTKDVFYGTQIKDKLDTFSTGIQQNPDAAQTYIDQGNSFIDESGLPQGEKDQLKKAWGSAAAVAKADGMLARDPQMLLDVLGGPRNAGAPSPLRSFLTPDKPYEAADNLSPNFQKQLGAMLNDMPAELKGQVQIGSGFRTNERQAELWQEALKKYGSEEEARKWVAPPGKSQHNHGNAADLNYASDAAKKWVHDNAARYGLNFPLGNEDWHIEPVGARAATDVTPDGASTSGNAERIRAVMERNPSKYAFSYDFARAVAMQESGGQGDNLFGLKGGSEANGTDIEAGMNKLQESYDQAKKALGREPTPGEVYAVHYQGSGAGPMILQNPNANFWATLEAAGGTGYADKVREANPWLKDIQTNADFLAWSNNKIGERLGEVTSTGDAVLNQMTYEKRLEYKSKAAATVNSIATEQAKQAKVEHDSKLNSLLLGITSGQGQDAIDAARSAGWLTDYDEIKKAQDALDAYQKKDEKFKSAVQNLANPNFVWNLLDPDQKKQLEAYVEKSGNDPNVGMSIWQKTGYLPDAASRSLRGVLETSSDPEKVLAAATLVGNMMADPKRPNPFAGAEGADALEKVGSTFNRMVNGLNLPPDEAARQIAMMNTPEYKAKIQIREDDIKTFKDDLFKTDQSSIVASFFDTSKMPFSGTPSLGATPAQKTAMLTDFVELASMRYKETGDKEDAKAYALGQLKKFYGVSNGALMKYPPEHVYPPSGDDSDPHGYIYRQAATNAAGYANKAHPQPAGSKIEVKPEDVWLTAISGNTTAENWRQGKQVPYQLNFKYTDPQSGQVVYDSIPASSGKSFVADPAAAQKEVTDNRMRSLSEQNAESAWKQWNAEKRRREQVQRVVEQGLWNETTSGPPPQFAPLPPAPPKPPSVIRQENIDATPTPPAPADTFSDPATGFMLPPVQ